MDFTLQGVVHGYGTSRLYCYLEDINGSTIGSLVVWSNDFSTLCIPEGYNL